MAVCGLAPGFVELLVPFFDFWTLLRGGSPTYLGGRGPGVLAFGFLERMKVPFFFKTVLPVYCNFFFFFFFNHPVQILAVDFRGLGNGYCQAF